MGVTRMNEECLKLKDHTAGYQTVQDIQRVVTEAIGGRAALSNEQLIDEVMVRLLPCLFSRVQSASLQRDVYRRLGRLSGHIMTSWCHVALQVLTYIGPDHQRRMIA